MAECPESDDVTSADDATLMFDDGTIRGEEKHDLLISVEKVFIPGFLKTGLPKNVSLSH